MSQAGNPNMRKKATNSEQKNVVLVLMLNSNNILFKISSIIIYNGLSVNVFLNIMMKYRGEVKVKKKQA